MSGPIKIHGTCGWFSTAGSVDKLRPKYFAPTRLFRLVKMDFWSSGRNRHDVNKMMVIKYKLASFFGWIMIHRPLNCP